MTLDNEIQRRIDLLKTFDNKMGVEVEFLNTPNKRYIYLSKRLVTEGLYVESDWHTTMPLLRVHACSHDVLYNASEETINILKKYGKDFKFDDADVDINLQHRDTAKELIDEGLIDEAIDELDLLRLYKAGDDDEYFKALRSGASHSLVFNKVV